MAKKAVALTYTFSNPNTSKEIELLLKKILIEKLLSQNALRCLG